MTSATQTQQAQEIARFVIDNGRVEAAEGQEEGWLESLRIEVEFEAGERALDNPEEIAQAAVDLYR